MDVLLQSLMNPGEMSNLQWLMLAIMLFVVVGSLYFVWKLYAIVMASRSKTPYKPNIGLKRHVDESTRRRDGDQTGGRPGERD